MHFLLVRHAVVNIKLLLAICFKLQYNAVQAELVWRCRRKNFSGYQRRESRVQRHAGYAGHAARKALYHFCFALFDSFCRRKSARRMRTQPKERNHKSSLLKSLLLNSTPTSLRCPPPAVCVLAYCTRFPTLRCLRRARFFLQQRLASCERGRLCYAASYFHISQFCVSVAELLRSKLVKFACPKKFTAMVTETDMIDYGNSFDKLTEQ